MFDREVISAIKYVSRMKPEFMLSEINTYVKEPRTTADVYNVIHPLAYDLGLKLIPVDSDYKVVRLPPAGPLILKEDEEKKLKVFFESPRVPPKLEKLVEQYVEKKTGKSWDDLAVLDKIRKAIVAQKAEYWKEGKKRRVTYETGYSVLGYLAYQFPVYFVQSEHILHEMAHDGILKDRMKILDVGTGPGVVPLAIVDFYRRLEGKEARIYSIEKYEEHIEAFMSLVPEYAKGTSVDVEQPIKADITSIKSEELPDGIDLMIFSNMLNELKELTIEQRADLVISMSKRLSPDGNIVIVEPADKVNSLEMRETTVTLMKKGLGVYSPCSFIWCDRCRPESCWTFEEKEDIKPTGLMEKVAECDEPYRYMNTDIKYSYAVLRKDRLTREEFRLSPKAKFARFSKMKTHVNRHINVVAAVMSNDLGDKKNHVFKLCDGTSVKPVYAVLPFYHMNENNTLLMDAKYGQIVEIDNVLARYNKEYDAYNLLVTRNTKVSPVSENQ